jgi:peptidoglycan/xylan/chitin deacetylase (PgdA/CDA1 family)
MRRAAFTVDVDRDVNVPLSGALPAGSAPRDGDGSPRFSSSARGLVLLVDALDELGIRGTFFLEAEAAQHIAAEVDLRRLLRGHEVASHGFSHEDLTGKSTGLPLNGEERENIIDRAAETIRDLTGVLPRGFRAPYQHVDDAVHELLAARGYLYDSSATDDIAERRIGPRTLPSGLTEMPLARGIDARGKHIHSYLWPMHEGKRRPDDYLHLLDQFDDGLMVLATHSWHVVETFAGPLDERQVEANLDNVKAVLEGAMDMGLEFVTLEEQVRGDRHER